MIKCIARTSAVYVCVQIFEACKFRGCTNQLSIFAILFSRITKYFTNSFMQVKVRQWNFDDKNSADGQFTAKKSKNYIPRKFVRLRYHFALLTFKFNACVFGDLSFSHTLQCKFKAIIVSEMDIGEKLKTLTLTGVKPIANQGLGKGAYGKVYKVKYRGV